MVTHGRLRVDNFEIFLLGQAKSFSFKTAEVKGEYIIQISGLHEKRQEERRAFLLKCLSRMGLIFTGCFSIQI